MLRKSDNQPITSRFGEAVWLNSFITPDSPDVKLKHQELVRGFDTVDERIAALWNYVAQIPYTRTVSAKLTVEGQSRSQGDTWLFPSEIITLAPKANCANKSFLLTSLLRNELPAYQVRCVMGHIRMDGIGAHAWCEVSPHGNPYILETTVTDIRRALVPTGYAPEYEPVLYLTDMGIDVVDESEGIGIIDERFGYCAVEFLREYLCERCINLLG